MADGDARVWGREMEGAEGRVGSLEGGSPPALGGGGGKGLLSTLQPQGAQPHAVHRFLVCFLSRS